MGRYRLVDTAGSELSIVELPEDDIGEDRVVTLPDGDEVMIVEIYDDEEHGKDGGVEATLVIEPT